MTRFGISVYLDKTSKEDVYAYLKTASQLGYSRIFTCFLCVPDTQREHYLKDFKEFMDIAHQLGFLVSVDTNPEVFASMQATPDNIKPFHDLGIDIIRLDGSFGGLQDVLITHNPYDIKIEYNASHDNGLEWMIRNGASKDQMILCHNFYPQRYTGLDLDYFMQLNKQWKQYHLPVAAFVSSNAANSAGPWPCPHGLPTVEVFRGMPIALQASYLLASGNVDDIIIGNFPATQEELCELAKVKNHRLQFHLMEAEAVSELEQKILYEFPAHMDRQDRSCFLIRSSYARGFAQHASIPVRSCDQALFERGDVLIVNDRLPRYLGELEIVLAPIQNDGERNLVGRIRKEELMLLDFMTPGRIFAFIK